MTTANPFAGIFSSPANDGNGFTDTDVYLDKHGSYINRLVEADIFRHSEGTDLAGQISCTIKAEVLVAQPRPLKEKNTELLGGTSIEPVPVGTVAKHFWCLERRFDGNYTFRGQKDLARFKGWLIAILQTAAYAKGSADEITDEMVTPSFCVRVMLGSSKANTGDAEATAALVQKAIELGVPEAEAKNLVDLRGMVFAEQVDYYETVPKQGRNVGKRVGRTAYEFAPLKQEQSAAWLKAA